MLLPLLVEPKKVSKCIVVCSHFTFGAVRISSLQERNHIFGKHVIDQGVVCDRANLAKHVRCLGVKLDNKISMLVDYIQIF